MRVFKLLMGAVSLGFLLTACVQNSNPSQAVAQKSDMPVPVLAIITRDAPETQLMALILSKAAADDGHTVRILLCDKGGDLALKAPPAISQTALAPKNMSPTGLLSNLIDSGIKVDVCAIYLPNREFGEEALLENVGVATPPDIAAYYTQTEAKILSF